jgi:hypothetical protein
MVIVPTAAENPSRDTVMRYTPNGNRFATSVPVSSVRSCS